MVSKELLEEAFKRYPPGTRFINACIYDGCDTYIKEVNKNATECEYLHRPSQLNQGITLDGIVHGPTACGYVYIDGKWADIVDDEGNIIKSFNEPTELQKAREWLYKED